MMKKKAQAWGFDVMVAVMVFFTGIVTFYLFALNYEQANPKNSAELKHDARIMADNLLSEGIPESWNISTVSTIGITKDNKIDQQKLENLYTLSQTEYLSSRGLLHTRFDYFITLSEPIIIQGSNVDGIGKEPINASSVVRVTRFTIYQDKPVTMYVIAWN